MNAFTHPTGLGKKAREAILAEFRAKARPDAPAADPSLIPAALHQKDFGDLLGSFS